MMRLRTLVLCDDQWHPAADVRRGLNAVGDSCFEFEFVLDGGQGLAALLGSFQRVMVAKANHRSATDPRPWLTAETQGAFRDFVQRGGGLFFVHGGTGYKDLPELRAVAGGTFLSHPDQCLVTAEPKARHVLTAGVQAFTARDEHYLMALEAADADVFLHTHSQHGVQPAGWTRAEGAGRVCVLTPGHNVEVWLHPEFQKLLRNGLNWLAGAN